MTSMGLVHQKYKVAVVQAAPVFLDLDATVDKTIALIEQAAAQSAKLIAFPETFIPGYPWQIWLGAPAWAIGRGFVQRYFDNSLSYDSPQAEKIRKAVKRAKLTAVIGLAELFALRPIRACTRLGGQQRREQGLRRRRLMFLPRPLRGGLPGHDR